LPPAAKTLFVKRVLDSQKLFIGYGLEKRVLDSQKLFIGYGLDTLFFFVYLCVSSWLKLDGGFRKKFLRMLHGSRGKRKKGPLAAGSKKKLQ
jgi:hypothetical protein